MNKKKKRITILDVAREAGVTDGTVSRALAADKRVHPETRRKIIEAAEKLDYRPHFSARSLRQPETGNMGLFWQGGSWLFHNDYYGSLVSGLADAAGKDGVHLVFYLPDIKPTEDPNAKNQKFEIKGIGELLDGRVDGAVVLSIRPLPEEQLSILRRSSLPVVLMSMHQEVPGFSQLLTGAYERTRLAVEKLLDSGHRRIGYMGHYKDNLNDEVVRKAMGDAFQKRGFRLEEGWLESADHWNLLDITRIERKLRRFFEEKYTAVISIFADQASLGIEVLNRMGKTVPGDMSLVAFGPLSPTAQFQKPKLWILEADLVKAGEETYELYKEVKEGRKPRSVTINWQWLGNGESVGPAPK